MRKITFLDIDGVLNTRRIHKRKHLVLTNPNVGISKEDVAKTIAILM